MLEQGDDGQQAFLRLMKGSNEVGSEANALRKILGDAQHMGAADDPAMRKMLLSLDRVARHLERANTELRNSLQNSKRFFSDQ
jgi:hypothetical protein